MLAPSTHLFRYIYTPKCYRMCISISSHHTPKHIPNISNKETINIMVYYIMCISNVRICMHWVYGSSKAMVDDGGDNNNKKIHNTFCAWLMLCAWPTLYFAPYTLHTKYYLRKKPANPDYTQKKQTNFSTELKSLRTCSHNDIKYLVYVSFIVVVHLENHKYHVFEQFSAVRYKGYRDTGRKVIW